MAKIKKSELKLYSTRDFEKRLGKNLHITQKEVKRLLYGYIDTVKELLLDETMDGVHIQGFEDYIVKEKPAFLTHDPRDRTPIMTEDEWKVVTRLSKSFTQKILKR